jgi:5-methylcytosine-specific restriction enzyme subunit McrC
MHRRGGWFVTRQKPLMWHGVGATEDIQRYLPGMIADIVIDNPSLQRRVVVETKFANALVPRQFGGLSLDSSHLFQLYAYLQSQCGQGDELAEKAEGLLLYPAVDYSLDEAITVQGHRIRFATIDLAQPPHEIRGRLLALLLTRT